MRTIVSLMRGALCAVAYVSFVTGCGAPQPPIGAPGPTLQSSGTETHTQDHRSWMVPEAKSETLLYVSNDGATVYVFSYPRGKLVGELTGFSSPLYLCSDKKGDVFVSNSISDYGLYEYAHGGTRPIHIFKVQGAIACSVDPTTGNLAVVAYSGSAVYVYPNAQGTPTEYQDSSIYFITSVAYDDSGNLFLDGEMQNNYFFLFELPSNGHFETINVPYSLEASVFQPIFWDGTDLDIGTTSRKDDHQARHPRRITVDRLAISGSSATIVGSVTLAPQNGGTYPQFWINRNTVIQPQNRAEGRKVDFFAYPQGGEIKAITVSGSPFSSLYGVTLSVAPR